MSPVNVFSKDYIIPDDILFHHYDGQQKYSPSFAYLLECQKETNQHYGKQVWWYSISNLNPFNGWVLLWHPGMTPEKLCKRVD